MSTKKNQNQKQYSGTLEHKVAEMVASAPISTTLTPRPAAIAAAPATPAVAVATPAVAAPVAAKPVAFDVSALIRDLRNASADLAREAATSLGAAGDRSAIAPLSEVVMNTNRYFHSVVRAAACASLGRLGDKSATSALIHGIADEMAEASAEAVRALALLQDVRAIEPLIEVVRNPRGYYLPVVRLAAVAALKKFADPRATAALQAVAADGNADAVLRAAAR